MCLRILVADDNPINLESARRTLVGCELVLVDTYQATIEALDRRIDLGRYKKLLRGEFGFDNWYGPDNPNETGSFDSEAFLRFHRREASVTDESSLQRFDAVLLDLFMPVNGENQIWQEFADTPMPVGFPLALMAARHRVAPFIGVATMTDRHSHPMASVVKFLSGRCWTDKPDGYECPAAFEINGARVGFFEAPLVYFGHASGDECHVCKRAESGSDRSDCRLCQGVGKYVQAKDWGKVLARLKGEE